jgi:Leucine-rich repeat (LRR) protein
MQQLTNLVSLEELDLQYNNLNELTIPEESFPNLHTLHLSYDRIPRDHLFALGNLESLQVLNMSSNHLGSLPMNLSFLSSLQELNLSSNNFGSQNKAGPALFKALSTVPFLRKLNLSRNRFSEFHAELLPDRNSELPQEKQVFVYLEELYFAFNSVQREDRLFWPVQQIPMLRYVVITGNPFAMLRTVAGTLMPEGTTVASN